MSDKKAKQLLQLYYRESERVRLLPLDALPEPDKNEQADFDVWLGMKRSFNRAEVTAQVWIKSCSAGHVTELYLYPDGRLEEYTLFKRIRTIGRWALVQGMIALDIQSGDDRYQSWIVANRNSRIHSAIEYKNGELYAYLKVAQTHPI
ncbi:hypothetical protein ABT56_15555 [Photobacterium aquae]|uniref:Uncharacterized protein n=1 Tax=Photobacterium aquae TaxID=1195763 RepID=A0A0J1GWQ4_9GAMM|nr:hypothetical protein [Photobacterium aquae]KLV04041.1 hypothetical protein ABT56_15555 [Photobacterium aquae]